MRTQSLEASDYARKNSQKVFEICSLVDRIQDEDHSQVLQVLDIVARDLALLKPRQELELMGLVERVKEHIRFERTQLFPIIRDWAVRGALTDRQTLNVRRALHSKFVYGWGHILEEFQEIQEGVTQERVLKNLEALGEELYWYVKVENTVLFPVLTKQLLE